MKNLVEKYKKTLGDLLKYSERDHCIGCGITEEGLDMLLKEAEERERERVYWERIKDRDKSDPNYSAQCCRDKTAYFYVPRRITNVKVVRQEDSWEFTIPEALNPKDDRPTTVTSGYGYGGQLQRTTRTPNKHGGVDIKIEDV